MTSRSKCLWAPVLVVLALVLFACSGGNGDTTPGPGPAFNLFVSVSPEVGSAPLLVTFSAVPSGGVEPYSYAWDFTSDGVIDSTKAQDQFPYLDSATLSVTVTDNAGKTVSTSRSITIIDQAPPTGDEPLTVRYNASPLQGNVPFNVQFTSYINGGKPPYKYSWDFNGDGVFDSFLKDPLYTYEGIGAQVGDRYVFYPVLQVEDSRGVIKTNLDDDDNNGVPDFKIQINAAPPQSGLSVNASANPLSGQAPLFVEFTGAVQGGSGEYLFDWDFGDGVLTDPTQTSIVTHTYLYAGVYQARVTVHDVRTGEDVTSAPLTITASQEQVFTLDIGSDITGGQVPFVVNFEAMPTNGTEPIVYQWDVFTDATPLEEEPSVGGNPALATAAVVTPDFSYRQNPAIHFGNTAGTGAPYSYVVRCVATDNNGNTAVSANLIRVIASPNTTYPFYECIRPLVVGGTSFPLFTGAGESADGIYNPFPIPLPWAPRANAAICSHPTGVSFIIGGEHLDETGNFERLVNPGDSMYMFVPATGGTGTGETSVGKFDTGSAGYIVALNDSTGPAFPSSPQTPFSPQWKSDLDDGDTCVPVQLDPEEDPATPPPASSLRSAPFTIVGSAAAVYMHERPETNPDGAYPGPGFWAQVEIPPGFSLDRDYQGFPEPKLWPWPDQACHGWGVDSGGAMTIDGVGSPVIYVLGGRTDATTPSDLVQKYYPYGFGNEYLTPWSQDLSFQTTGNQSDIWSPYFLRPDQDQFDGNGLNFDPQVEERRPGLGGSQEELPTLPIGVYGLMAVKIETGVDTASPDFPNGPYRVIFTFGGIDETGTVLDEMRRWNVNEGEEPGGGGTEEEVIQLIGNMPTERAYGKAVLIPSPDIKIALVGGIDNNGMPLNTVDVFSFDDQYNPGNGGWETFEGTLPEALEACGAGFHPGYTGEDWIVTFGGWTSEKFTTKTYTARLGSAGNQVITELAPSVPRSHAGSGQAGSEPLTAQRAGAMLGPVLFNRYFIIGGVDENGMESIVETLSLPIEN